MAAGAVKLMATTVEALYVSSRPGPIELSPWSLALALSIGVGVAVVSALSPAHEAMQVSPVDAMAQGRREYTARVRKGRDLLVAAVLATFGTLAARMPAVGGKPLFGYIATILLIAASAFAIPALVIIRFFDYGKSPRQVNRGRRTAGLPQPCRFAAENLGAGCFPFHCHRHDGIGRHHGGKFPSDGTDLDERSTSRPIFICARQEIPLPIGIRRSRSN